MTSNEMVMNKLGHLTVIIEYMSIWERCSFFCFDIKFSTLFSLWCTLRRKILWNVFDVMYIESSMYCIFRDRSMRPPNPTGPTHLFTEDYKKWLWNSRLWWNELVSWCSYVARRGSNLDPLWGAIYARSMQQPMLLSWIQKFLALINHLHQASDHWNSSL